MALGCAPSRSRKESPMLETLKAENLKLYKEILRLFMKYGRSDLIKQAGIHDELSNEGMPDTAHDLPHLANEFVRDLERLGPTFIKLGQVLSTRADLLPLPFFEALSRLQDNVKPFAFTHVQEIIEQDLGA